MTNEIYSLVDEDNIASFQNYHQLLMKDIYYEKYLAYCDAVKRKPLVIDEFYKNMHRRRIQLHQQCCPYCGEVDILIKDKRIDSSSGYNYCTRCGRGSALENVNEQLHRLGRIHSLHKTAIKEVKNKTGADETIFAFDVFQLEIIEMVSIIEILLRDYFEALLYMESGNKKTGYITSTVLKKTGNDFMNIEKANNHYKKAFGINLKEVISKDVWDGLIDIVNVRNAIVHNNGKVDQTFKGKKTYEQLKDKIKGDMILFQSKDIDRYIHILVDAVVDISNRYLEEYYIRRNTRIANHYFNEISR